MGLSDQTPTIQGGTDNTDIGNISDSLNVNVRNSTSVLTPGTSGLIKYEDMTAIARGTTIVAAAAFTTVFTYTGSGYVYGFTMGIETASTNWYIRLIIDGVDIFNGSTGIFSTDLNSTSIYNAPSVTQSPLPGFGFIISTNNLQWGAPNNIPIKYSTSVVLSVQRISSNKNWTGGLMILTKDT